MPDYNALAQKFGGTSAPSTSAATTTPGVLPKPSAKVVLPPASKPIITPISTTSTTTPSVVLPKNKKPAPVDYSALAQKFGAIESGPAPEAKPFKYDVVETPQAKIQRYQSEANVAKEKAKKANSFVERIIRPIADSVLPGVASLGDTVGGIINTNTLTDDHNKTIQNLADIQFKLVKKINDDEKVGKDTTKLKQLYNQGIDSLQTIQDQYNEATGGAKKTWQQVAGELGMTGINLLTAGTYGKAAKGMEFGKMATKSKVLPNVVQATADIIQKPLKSVLPKAVKVAEGFAVGEAYDITQNLQDGKTGTDVLTDGYAKYIGATIPTVLSGAKGVSTKIGRMTPAQAEERLAKNLNETFKKGTTGVKKISDFAEERGIDLGKELVERRIKPIVENDRLKFGTEPFKQLDDEIAANSKIIDDLVAQYPDTKISSNELKKQVASEISRDPVASRQGETRALIKEAQQKIDDYVTQTGKSDFTLQEIQEFKKGAWELSKKFKISDIGKSDASSYLGTTFKNIIEKEVPDANIKAINQKIGRAQEVYKLLNKTNSLQDGGIVLRGGKVGKFVSKVAGATTGAIVGTSVGGPVGGIIGAYAGAKVSDLIRNISQKSSILGPLDRILIKFADQAPENAAILEAKQFLNDVKAGKKPTLSPRVENTLIKAYEEKAKVLPPEEIKQMEMGTYKLKTEKTGRVIPTGDYRKPGVNFYPSKKGEPSSSGSSVKLPRSGSTSSENKENTSKTANTISAKNSIDTSVRPPVKKSKYLPMNEGFAKAKALLAGGALAGVGSLAIPYKDSYAKDPVPKNYKAQDKPAEVIEPTSSKAVAAIKDTKGRPVDITEADLEELRPIIFGEIGNRGGGKRELETRVLLGTALNRLAALRGRGVNASLKSVLTAKNQYQAYKGKQYNEYFKNPNNPKTKEVNVIVDKLIAEIASGNYKDITNNAKYYIHNDDGTITYDDKRRF